MAKTNDNIFLELPALKVTQPLGDFYVISISAKALLDISFSEPLRYIDNKGNVQGNQRVQDEKRLKSIATYIESVEMAFPNSIILAANYTPFGEITENTDERWRIERDEACNTYKLIIPQKKELAAIIDGQHRLKAFAYVNDDEKKKDLELVCSIYFDLPNSYQAFLFATINSNQKKVSRSLALEQFGYNVDDEPEKAWTPEKFAVFLSRKLNIEQSSPFFKHIKVAPLSVDKLFPEGLENSWSISTATVVDGICSLISSNVKRDRIIMQHAGPFSGRSRSMIKDVKDFSPLRSLYIAGKDQTIYNIIINYFAVLKDVLWSKAGSNSYIIKTVGINASFDLLKMILSSANTVSPDEIDFKHYIIPSRDVDFSDRFYQASGIGKSRIKNTLGLAAQLIPQNKIKKSDLDLYLRLIAGGDTLENALPTSWEIAAEEAMRNSLSKAKWNYDDNSVSIPSEETEDYIKIPDLQKLKAFLKNTSLMAFVAAMPDDQDFRDEQLESFDIDALLETVLSDYEENLKRINWR